MQSSEMVFNYRNTFDMSGQISGTIPSSRDLSDRPAHAREMCSHGKVECGNGHASLTGLKPIQRSSAFTIY